LEGGGISANVRMTDSSDFETTATTILALIPVLTSTGRGADIMVPMAIPSFGGMVIEVLTMLVVPVLYCMVKEIRHHAGRGQSEAVNS